MLSGAERPSGDEPLSSGQEIAERPYSDELDAEIQEHRDRHRSGKLRVIPVVLRWCLWEVHPWLKELRAHV